MKLVAVIILFHPDVKSTLDDIVYFIREVDRLIVYKNSKETIIYPEEYVSKIREMGTGENQYIAKALNECIDYCVEEGYDYLLTMDQDSRWNDFALFKKEVEELKEKDTVMYAPNARNLYSKGSVIIEDNVWIGENASILSNVRIEHHSVIGYNAVVSKNVPLYCIVYQASCQ